MRSFFSKILISNWLFLVVLLLTAIFVLYITTIISSTYYIILFISYLVFSLYVAFHISYKIAESVTEQLRALQERTRLINAGEFNSALIMTNISELSELSLSINAMSERLKLQFNALNIEKEKFNLLLENLKEGVFAIDKEKRLLFQNKSIPKLLIPEGSQSRTIDVIIKEKKILQFLNQHIANETEGKINIELNKKFYSIRLYSLKSDDKTLMYIGVVLDKTEDRERQLLREQFVQSASHELKTPITSIKGYAETLDSKLKLNPKSNEKKFLDAILRNTDRMIRIVDDMLTISKLETANMVFQPELFSLKELVKNIEFTILGVLKLKGQKFIVEIPNDLIIFADLVQMEHVLLNLIQNASIYSPENCKIGVKAIKEEKYIKISVWDQGIGIEEKELDRIFERFYRVDANRSRSEGGTGLGLSIVKHIIKLHSGWVSVSSIRGEGSTFTVNLPVDNPSSSL
jgi:two-component system phosphate regulon sensor histidine kinase PhoR